MQRKSRCPSPQVETDPGPSVVQLLTRTISDDAVFQLDELRALLGLRTHTLKREARKGRLRVAKRAGRLWCVGRWVRQWLEDGEIQRPAKPAAN
jgi:hypothetical protein